MVECAAEIPLDFANTREEKIGITAGASTPDWSLKEVVTNMMDKENMNTTDQMDDSVESGAAQAEVAQEEQVLQQNEEVQEVAQEAIQNNVEAEATQEETLEEDVSTAPIQEEEQLTEDQGVLNL